MRIPGIKQLACVACSALPAELEMQVMAGMTPDVRGIAFTAVSFIGEAVCNVESSNEDNGNTHKFDLTFTTHDRINYRRHAWLVTKRTGETFLIGSKDSIPSFKCKDMTAGPTGKNAAEVTIALESPCSWVHIGDVAPTVHDDGTVTYDDWRSTAEGMFALKQHRHPSSEIDDNPTDMTQEQANAMLLGEIDELTTQVRAAL